MTITKLVLSGASDYVPQIVWYSTGHGYNTIQLYNSAILSVYVPSSNLAAVKADSRWSHALGEYPGQLFVLGM